MDDVMPMGWDTRLGDYNSVEVWEGKSKDSASLLAKLKYCLGDE